MHSEDRVVTTHFGSLVRPPGFRATIERRRDGGPFDPAEQPVRVSTVRVRMRP